MRGVAVASVLLISGCDGVFNIREIADAPALGDARVCAPGTPFPVGTAVPIDGSYSVEAARFSPDRSLAHLALCPANGDTTGCDLYVSQYSPVLGEFTQHTKLTAVSAPDVYDSYPTLSPEGQFLVFGSRRPAGLLRVWMAQATNGSFEAPVVTQLALAGEHEANEPYMLADGTLYFAAYTAGARWSLYRATGGAPSFGGSAERVPGFRTDMDAYAPVVANDELELVFGARELTGPGEIDIYTATRPDAASSFSPASMIAELSNATGNDWPVWLSPDGCSLYYIQQVGGVSTLYVTTR